MATPKQLRKLYAAGYQLTPEAYSVINSVQNIDDFIDRILQLKLDKAILSDEDIKILLETKEVSATKVSSDEKNKAQSESKGKDKIIETSKEKEQKTGVLSPRKEKISPDLEILKSPQIQNISSSVTSFHQYFESRFDSIASIFRRRRDITNLTLTSDLEKNKRRDKISLISIIYKKQKTRKGNFILELEDKTGKITAIITTYNPDLAYKAEFILDDSILCFIGDWNGDVLNVRDVYWPDVPYNHKPNYSREEVLGLFISDIHVGSKNFAEKLFLKVEKLLNSSLESDKYNAVGEKIKYVFVAGDVIDGVGVYPGQVDDLALENIHLQYLQATKYFEKFRDDIEILIIPGNHDGARAAEPQTPILKDFAPELYGLDNVHLLGSPAYIKAHNVEVLMTHGNSIMDINSAISAIPHETSIPAMMEMLKNRHLVPIYGKRTSIAPEPVDQLVITQIPDILHAGHTHIAGDEDYKGVTIINSGTFQYQTSYQKSMNINPTTGSTYVINFQNLQRTVIDFNNIN